MPPGNRHALALTRSAPETSMVQSNTPGYSDRTRAIESPERSILQSVPVTGQPNLNRVGSSAFKRTAIACSAKTPLRRHDHPPLLFGCQFWAASFLEFL